MSNQPATPDSTNALHDDWTLFVDGLLRGLGHALSNRLAGLSALSDIAADAASGGGNATDDLEVRELMIGEVARLQELNRVVKLMPQERNSVAEAVVVADVANDAIAVLGLLPAGRTAQWRVVTEGEPQPVRTERWALLRALMLLAHGAHSVQDVARCQGMLSVSGDGECTRITVTVLPLALPDSSGTQVESSQVQPHWRPGPALTALVNQLGAELSHSDDGTILALPTLQAVRRRERAGS